MVFRLRHQPVRRARRHANRPSRNALCDSPGAGCPSRDNWASAARRDSRSSASKSMPIRPSQGKHAVVGLIQGQWTVRDLRSTNGTYVNGARLAAGETRSIGNGDRVGFSQGLQVEVEIGGGGTGGY